MTPTFCAHCGTEIPANGFRFCPRCGKPVGSKPPEQTAPQPPTVPPPPPRPSMAKNLCKRAVLSLILALPAAFALSKAVPHLVNAAAALICTKAPFFCPGQGPMTWQPLAVAGAACCVGFFLILSILKLLRS